MRFVLISGSKAHPVGSLPLFVTELIERPTPAFYSSDLPFWRPPPLKFDQTPALSATIWLKDVAEYTRESGLDVPARVGIIHYFPEVHVKRNSRTYHLYAVCDLPPHEILSRCLKDALNRRWKDTLGTAHALMELRLIPVGAMETARELAELTLSGVSTAEAVNNPPDS